MDEVGLGKKLQLARQRAGLTQQQLCQKANLSYSTLAKIERGAIKSPSVFTIQSIAGALGTTLSQLMGESQAAAPIKHQSKTGVKFVYFDINGCLVRFFQRAFGAIARDYNRSADTIETAFWRYNDDACRGDMSLEDFNLNLAKELKIPSITWTDYYLNAVDPITEMQELVKWAGENYRIGLLSNIMPGLVETMKTKLLIPNLAYDAIVDSSSVHAIKPEEKIYKIAEEQAKVSPSEIMLIDDSRVNVMAAGKMGWHVLWFDDYRPDEGIERAHEALFFEDAAVISQ